MIAVRALAAAATTALVAVVPSTSSASEVHEGALLFPGISSRSVQLAGPATAVLLGHVPLPVASPGEVAPCVLADAAAPSAAADVTVLWRGDGSWQLTDSSGPRTVRFGRAGDVPLVGDWDGDGDDDLGVARGRTYYLARGTGEDGLWRSFSFGSATDVHGLVGDWDGDGDDEPAVLRRDGGTNRFFFATDAAAGGGHPYSRTWGRWGQDRVLVGDLDGDGDDSLVLQREVAGSHGAPTFLASVTRPVDGLRVDRTVRYGRSGDLGVVGDVDGDGRDEIGVLRAG